MSKKCHPLIILILFIFIPSAHAAILSVCKSGCVYNLPSQALGAAQPGDTIQISPGTYINCLYISKNNITIEGVNGRPALSGQVCAQKGIIVTAAQNAVIRNIELYGASNNSNYAGIRHDALGFNLTLDRVYIHDNDNGILSSSSGDTVLIQNSKFENNGMNDSQGYAHNLYINRSALVTFKNSQSLRAKLGGHLFKTRAAKTVIDSSVLASLEGRDSRNVDASNGGEVVITNSVLEKGPNSENNELIAYAPEGASNGAIKFSMTGNKIIEDRGNGPVVLLYQTPGSILINNNIFVGPDPIANVGSYPNNTLYASRSAANYQAFPWLPNEGTAPQPPGTISPDGSTLDAGTAGQLITSVGIWTFGGPGAGGYMILLNGQSADGGSAVRMMVANGGKMYVYNNAGNWFLWTGTTWAIQNGPPTGC